MHCPFITCFYLVSAIRTMKRKNDKPKKKKKKTHGNWGSVGNWGIPDMTAWSVGVLLPPASKESVQGYGHSSFVYEFHHFGRVASSQNISNVSLESTNWSSHFLKSYGLVSGASK